MSKTQTQKETIEYDAKFLDEWNRYCDGKGYVKRAASHAARIAFMKLMTPEQREKLMLESMPLVTGSRESRGKQRAR